MIVDLPDDAKQELSDALKNVVTSANQLRRCLTVQLEGIGRFDSSAARKAADRFERYVMEASEIGAETVPSIGLFDDSERARPGR